MGLNRSLLSPADFRSRGRTPLYARLEERLRHLIETGVWKANERIPTERELVDMTGIGINTVKKALKDLEQAGYLQRRQGAGTFVTPPETLFGLHRYYGMMRDFGDNLGRHHKEFLSLQLEDASDDIRRYLALAPGVQVFRLERLLHVGGRKSIHTFSWLPANLFAGLDAVPVDEFTTFPLYELLATRFNVISRRSRELLAACTASAYVASLLEIPEGTPMLATAIISFDSRSRPFEFRRSCVLTDVMRLYREF